jgi:peptide/nickel transport system substrate-binding protein
MTHKNIIKIPAAMLLVLLITSCIPGLLAKPTATSLPPTVTPTPAPRILTICLGHEPDSLYPYGAVDPLSQKILKVLFPVWLTSQENQLSSPLLERMPTLESGDLTFDVMDVKSGDLVVDAEGNLATLAAGVAVFPHGCTSAECVQVWDGKAPLQLDKQKINFQLKEGLKWSDGQPLTAADSVYSYKLAADDATPLTKENIDITAAYSAISERTIQWVGKPGFLSLNLEKLLWMPLPGHLWNKYSPAELLKTDAVTRQPMGWGAYMIQSWTAGKTIQMIKNPNYSQNGQGSPGFDFINFIILEADQDPAASLISGKCDLVDSSAVASDDLVSVIAAQKAGQFKTILHVGSDLELLVFGIKPATYDDSYFPYGTDRPAFFDDVRTRQAIAACIDRQAIINDFVAGQGQIPTSAALLNKNPENQPTVQEQGPSMAEELFTAAGWLDYDKNPATPRVSINAKNVPNGRNLSVTLLSTDSIRQGQIADRIAASLIQCGIAVTRSQAPIGDVYKPAPDGLVFGRKFDLALLSLKVDENTNCQLLESAEIPSQLNFWMGKTSGGMNFTGYANPLLDSACQQRKRAGLNSTLAQTSQGQLDSIIQQELPFIPLFFKPETTLMRSDLCGYGLDEYGSLDFATLGDWSAGSSCIK